MSPSPRPFRLLLMRHGQTHGNVAGALDTGMPGLDLTDLGRAQADAAARVLDGNGIEQVYVSKLVRTHQTAAPLVDARRIDPVELAGVHEITAGAYEMATDHDAVMGYLSTVRSWVEGDLSLRMPGGETGTEFLERYDADVERAASSGAGTVLLVSHGAAIRTWVASRVAGATGRPEAVQPLHNTAVITLEGHPSTGWRLLDWHADPIGGHLLPEPAVHPFHRIEQGEVEDPTAEPPSEVEPRR